MYAVDGLPRRSASEGWIRCWIGWVGVACVGAGCGCGWTRNRNGCVVAVACSWYEGVWMMRWSDTALVHLSVDHVNQQCFTAGVGGQNPFHVTGGAAEVLPRTTVASTGDNLSRDH